MSYGKFKSATQDPPRSTQHTHTHLYPRISDAMVLCFVSDIRPSQRDRKRLKAETCPWPNWYLISICAICHVSWLGHHSLTKMKYQRVDFETSLLRCIGDHWWKYSRQKLMPHAHTQMQTEYTIGDVLANPLVKEMDSKSALLEKLSFTQYSNRFAFVFLLLTYFFMWEVCRKP